MSFNRIKLHDKKGNLFPFVEYTNFDTLNITKFK